MSIEKEVLAVCQRLDECYDTLDYDTIREISVKHNLDYDNGATRWCLHCDRWKDFVLKFPRYEETSIDYCEIEVNNYKKAVEYGIEKILLPIECIYETKNELKIYKQEKYTCALSDMKEKDYERLKKRLHNLQRQPITNKCLHSCLDYCRINNVWLARIIQLYGKNFVKNFEQWTHCCKVNDLHTSNIGFKGKNPIILDYAGYFG